MKRLTGKSWARNCLIALVCAAPLFAFTLPLRGGDSFEIHLGKTRVVQQAIHVDKSVKTVDLSAASAGDQLKVSFSHCGKTGGTRSLFLKDNNRIIKQWKFEDIRAGESPVMSIAVKDLQSLLRDQEGRQLTLFYTSDLMKNGMTLVKLTQANSTARAR